jgi:glycosyltransferase involved in cell wall biosynthesis
MADSALPVQLRQGDAWVVIAAYKEGGAIGETVRSLLPAFPNVVVVDDGSPDETGTVASAQGAAVVTHPMNLGQGAALQTGIIHALECGARWIITFDADGQHSVDDAVRLLETLKAKDVDIICGSRFLGSAPNMPLSRRLVLKLAVLFTWLTTGIRMTDAHNGLRAMTASAAKRIEITQNRMAHASEIIGEIRRKKLSHAEAPVTILYTEYSLAKGQRLANSLNIVLELLGGRLHK